MTVLIAHISDPHINGTAETAARATRTVDYLRGLAQFPDALVVTGDITDNGTPEEYEEVTRLLGDLPFPVVFCPGNHDDRAALRKGLLGQEAASGPVNTAHRADGFAVLSCDSTIPGQDGGHLAETTLEWIRAALADLPEDTPVLLAMHHPPVRVHHPMADSMALDNPHEVSALIRQYPAIAGVLCGHAHTGAVGQLAGRPVLLAPGVTSTLNMTWENGTGPTRTQPPGVAFHVLTEDASLTTHFRAVP